MQRGAPEARFRHRHLLGIEGPSPDDTVAICGDILHSRVARSNIALLNTMGARVRVVAPRTLLPAEIERLGVEVFHDMAQGLADVDIV
jgi:aspartate carbamoyltransferase catalytic subunit